MELMSSNVTAKFAYRMPRNVIEYAIVEMVPMSVIAVSILINTESF